MDVVVQRHPFVAVTTVEEFCTHRIGGWVAPWFIVEHKPWYLTLEGPCIIFCNIYTFQRDTQCSSTDCLLMHRCQLYMFRTVTVHPQELLFRCCMCRLWYVARNALSDTSRWYNVWGSNIMVKGKHKIPFKSRNFSYKQKSWRTILLHIPHLDPNPTSF